MARVWGIALVACMCVVGQALTPSSYFTLGDKERFRNTFDSVRPYTGDLEALHYSILGFTLLEEALQTPQKSCDVIKNNIKTDDVDSLFFGSSAAQTLKTQGKTECKFPTGNAEKVLNDAITAAGATTLTIYHATAAMHNLGMKIDSAKVTTALNDALKADDSPLSNGYAFHAAALLGGDLKKFHDLIEDIVQQSDEVDEKFAQFEGGLYTTAVVIEGAYKLAAAANKAPTLQEEKVIQFANYFLSRKHVQHLKNAVTILSVATTLSNNKFHVPITVTRASQVSVSDKYPIVQVRVSNLLGKSLGKLTVTADQARKLDDQAVVLNKEKFTVSTTDASLYELDFKKVQPESGLYKISISVSPQQADKRLLGTAGAEVEVKVTTQVAVESVEIGVGDKDQSSTPKSTKLQHPNKAANVLEADHHQKLVMKFTLKDLKRNKPITAHQAFVRFTSHETQQEIAFVAEPDSSSVYKFDLDVGGTAKEFGHMSGKYTMDLVIGDAVIQNPLSWTVADIALSFPEGATPRKTDPYRYSKKPEIKHIFREPEVRPPTVVSTLFTVLCAVPLLLLLVVWAAMGANISNFPFSLSALGFHICLGAMFGLYYLYWLRLDMFTTLRYLGILAIPTFLFGNRLLSGIAARRKTT